MKYENIERENQIKKIDLKLINHFFTLFYTRIKKFEKKKHKI